MVRVGAHNCNSSAVSLMQQALVITHVHACCIQHNQSRHIQSQYINARRNQGKIQSQYINARRNQGKKTIAKAKLREKNNKLPPTYVFSDSVQTLKLFNCVQRNHLMNPFCVTARVVICNNFYSCNIQFQFNCCNSIVAIVQMQYIGSTQ